MATSLVRQAAALVGRQSEVAMIEGHLQQRRTEARNPPRLLVLEGPSGVGKTRLIEEALATVSPQARALVVRCQNQQTTRGLPLVTALRSLGDQADLDGSGRSFEDQLLESVVRHVDYGLAAITIDDIQWADDCTIEVIRRLLDRLDPSVPAAAVFATLRTDVLNPVAAPADGPANAEPLRVLLRHSATARVKLAGLSPEEGTQLLIGLGTPITVDETLLALTELVDGNPLLLEDLAVQLKDVLRDLPRSVGLGQVLDRIELSTTVAEEARRRVGGLEPGVHETLTVLALAAVTDERWIMGLLQALEIEDPQSALDSAEDVDLIRLRQGEIVFAHPSIPQALLADLRPSRRRRLHRRIGAAMQADAGRDEWAIEIVWHLSQGDLVADDAAYPIARRAIELATARWDWLAVVRACRFARNAAPPEELGRLLLHEGIAQYMLGEPALAVEAFEQAETHCVGQGDLGGTIYAAIGRCRSEGTFRSVFDRGETTEARLEELLAEVEHRDPFLAAELLADLAFFAWIRSDYRTAIDRCDRCLEVAPATDAINALVRAMTCRGLVEYARCQVSDSLASLDHACRLSADASDPVVALTPRFRLPYAQLAVGRVGLARESAAATLDDTTTLGITGLKVFSASVLVACTAAQGDITTMESTWRAIELWGSATGEVMATANAGLASAFALSVRGETAAATDRLTETLAPLLGPDPLTGNPFGSALKAWIDSEDPSRPVRSESVEPPAAVGRGVNLFSVSMGCVAAELARLTGAEVPPGLVSILGEAVASGQRVSSGVPVLLERILGRALIDGGEPTDGRRHLDSALALARSETMASERARVILDLLETGQAQQPEEGPLLVELADVMVEHRLVGLMARVQAVDGRVAASVRSGLDAAVAPIQDGEAIIMLADIVESTRQTRELGERRYRELARVVERHLRQSVGSTGGRTLEGLTLGDGVVAEFASAAAAVEAALAAAKRTASATLDVRIGLHRGPVVREGNDVFGSAINIAARVSDVARPGRVMLSAGVAEDLSPSVRSRLDNEGEFVMKGLDQPLPLWSIEFD